MKFFRAERVTSVIQKELGTLILREIEVEGAFMTITRVDVGKKMDNAVVHVSVIPEGKSDEALKILRQNAGRLQHLLLKKMNIKPMPRIIFTADHGMEKAAAIEKALLDEHTKE